LKVLFQALCKEGYHRNDTLQKGDLKNWKSLLNEFNVFNNLRVQRCYYSLSITPVSIQQHGFSDAYCQAYMQQWYIYIQSWRVDVQIVASKTGVAPIKQQSIPQLELLGCDLLHSEL